MANRPRSKSAPDILSTAKETTFLTVDPSGNRAPSAYHVENNRSQTGMRSQRSRQQHDHGPSNTEVMRTVHAFTQTGAMQVAVADNVDETVARTGMNVSQALRLEIMDGLASPTASFGAHHLETFTHLPNSMANPHISGGRVQFAQSNSPLGNFNSVVSNTEANRLVAPQHRTYATDGATAAPTPQVTQFNQSALAAQRSFTQGVLKK
jgi:hypothetical protein